MKKALKTVPVALAVTALAVAVLASCGGRTDDSAMRRAAASVARDSLDSNLRYYRLAPKFEQQLGSMVDKEFSSLSAKKEDIPMELNQEVLININSFLNDRRGFMTRSLSRGQKYIPLMKAILRQKGLPENLVYLALIESGFRTDAISVASAVGPWQFISSTGRNYGLTIDEWVDERRDPVKSTYAAADYLITLHDMFNSWPLAIAAYNSGEGKIQRGLQRPNVESYWDMSSQSGFLAEETKRYVPSYLAAAIIARDPGAYGLEVEWSPPDTWDEVVVTAPLQLMTAAQLAGTTLDRIQELNPHLRKLTTPPNLPEFVLRVPSGSRVEFYRNYARLPGSQREGSIRIHTASRGETLEAAASRYGADPDLVREFNGLTGNPRLSAGQELVVPVGVRSPESALAGVSIDAAPPRGSTGRASQSRVERPPAAPSTASPPPGRGAAGPGPGPPPRLPDLEPVPARVPASTPPVATASSRAPGATPSSARTRTAGSGQVIHSISHVVRQGDTLSTVAGLYGVDMDRLRSDNRIRGDTLYVGQILTVRSNIPLQAQSRPSTRTTWVEVTPGEPLYHTVQRGDTVGAIAERYRVTQAQLRELNNLSGNSIRAGQKLRVGTGPAAPAPSSAASGRLIEYKVREGDTLSTVAESFGMKTADLRAANRLSGDVIRPGQTLRVKDPGGGTGTAPAAGPAVYEVKSGDTVSQIAERFRLTSAELRSLNNLSGDTIRAGQKLRVSSAAAAATLSPASPGVEDLRVAEGPAVYEVKSGETLSQIAERFRTSTAALRSLNGLSGDTIRTGQRLRVGSSSAAAGASQAATPGAGDTPAVVYEVKSGETVSQIAERFRMSSAELRALNGLSGDTIRVGQRLRVRGGGAAGIPSGDGGPASPGASGPGSASSGTGVYEVRSGDTVSQVAERFGMSSADLRALNNLSGDTIRAGQRLRVRGGASPSQGASPGGTPPLARQAPPSSGTGVYEVRTGDTVSQIAESFGMSSAELRALNNLSGDTIRVGQRLQVSGGGSPASRPQAPASPPQAPASPPQAPASPPQAPAAPQPSQPAAPSFAPGQIPLNAPPPPPQSQAPGPRTASGSLRDPAPGSGSGTYEVQSGDTVSQIAERHGMSSADLRALNNLSGDTIRVGQKLRVSGSIRRTGSSGPSVPSGSPGGGASAYKVQDGDTLFSIASRHGMSVDELRRLNGRIGDIVRPGETIRVK